MEHVLAFLQYFALSLFYTLGAVVLCGLISYLASRAFVHLAGGGKFVYVTAILGTPIHELGHAIACLPFGHKITEMRLLLPPRHPSGSFGYVEHSYNPRNLWARLGNLFIGIAPIFSCLGVILLSLFLCFPAEWESYLAATARITPDVALPTIAEAVLSLLISLPSAFAGADWWIPAIGITVMLFVSQHATLSTADVKGSLSAFPIYLLLLLLVTLPTYLLGASDTVLDALFHFHLWTLSFFAIAIALSLVWLAIALILRILRGLFRMF